MVAVPCKCVCVLWVVKPSTPSVALVCRAHAPSALSRPPRPPTPWCWSFAVQQARGSAAARGWASVGRVCARRSRAQAHAAQGRWGGDLLQLLPSRVALGARLSTPPVGSGQTGTVQVFRAVSAWLWVCGVQRGSGLFWLPGTPSSAPRFLCTSKRHWRVWPWHHLARPTRRPHGDRLGLDAGHLCSSVSLMHVESTRFHVSGELVAG